MPCNVDAFDKSYSVST